MAVVLQQGSLCPDTYMLSVSGLECSEPGQFFMLHLCRDSAHILPRPISVFESEGGVTRFVYKVVGRGTRLLSLLEPGDELRATGPLGNGFPVEGGDAALIGGGLGIAPLYALAKAKRAAEPNARLRIYLGYSSAETFLLDEFQALGCEVRPNVGGYVTDDVDFSLPGAYYACGPAPMMSAAAIKAKKAGARLYVSLESRMGCGVGACFACSVATKHGNKRVCKDGPVFLAEEIYYEQGT